jgi:hypothetical protein
MISTVRVAPREGTTDAQAGSRPSPTPARTGARQATMAYYAFKMSDGTDNLVFRHATEIACRG